MLAKPTNPDSFLFRDYFEIIFCQIVVGIAIVCQPHIITKSLLLKHDGDVKKYLWAGLTTEMLFFLVVFAGLYARLTFPDMRINGEMINVDSMMSAYVVSEFPVFVSIILILGLISAGLSTLEGLIQSLSTTITTDILKPILGQARIEGQGHKREIYINRGVIVLLGLATIYFTYQQLVYPNLSVGIFAQNGVYAYFSAAFIPVLAGTFFKNLPLRIPVAAAFTAVVVHFSVYYGGLTSYMDAPVRNPGIAAALAICASTLVAGILYFIHRKQAANKNL
jgi:sodium/pantothenate symporter